MQRPVWGSRCFCDVGALRLSGEACLSGLLAVQGVRYFYRAPWSAPAQVLRACLSCLLGEITKGLLGSCLGLLGGITKGLLGCCLGESLGDDPAQLPPFLGVGGQLWAGLWRCHGVKGSFLRGLLGGITKGLAGCCLGESLEGCLVLAWGSFGAS